MICDIHLCTFSFGSRLNHLKMLRFENSEMLQKRVPNARVSILLCSEHIIRSSIEKAKTRRRCAERKNTKTNLQEETWWQTNPSIAYLRAKESYAVSDNENWGSPQEKSHEKSNAERAECPEWAECPNLRTENHIGEISHICNYFAFASVQAGDLWAHVKTHIWENDICN